MELMQLQMLVAAVEEGSIGKGAERVLRSQPAVSMALRKLEEEIGVPLFDRSKRHHYSLTTAAAAKNSHTEIIKALLAKGADLNAKDKSGKTALELAQTQGKTEMVQLLKKP